MHPFELSAFCFNKVDMGSDFVAWLLMQEGKVRLKLAKILKGYDDVHFENSFATGEGIRAVSCGSFSYFRPQVIAPCNSCYPSIY